MAAGSEDDVVAASSEGWYEDPNDPRLQRWFDGGRWTARVRRADRMPDSGGSRSRATRILLWVVAIVLTTAAVLSIAAVVLFYIAFSQWGDNK